MKQQKTWYKSWWGVTLIVLGLVFLYSLTFVGNNDSKSDKELSEPEQVEEIIKRKGYDYLGSSYYNDVASIKMGHYKRYDSSSDVLPGLQTLYRVYGNASYYFVEFEVKGETCSYMIGGDSYRYYYVENLHSTDGYFWLKNQIEETRKCD